MNCKFHPWDPPSSSATCNACTRDRAVRRVQHAISDRVCEKLGVLEQEQRTRTHAARKFLGHSPIERARRSVIVVGIDPGFASMGLCKFDLLPSGAEFPFDVLLVETEKSAKKREVRAADDNVRRAREIHEAVTRYLHGTNVVAICAEAMSFPRSSSVAAKVAMTWGVLASIAEARGIPILQASPQETKRALCGVKNASKEDVEAALIERYESAADLVELVTKSKREHVVDAMAAVVACLDSEAIRMARRLRSERAFTSAEQADMTRVMAEALGVAPGPTVQGV